MSAYRAVVIHCDQGLCPNVYEHIGKGGVRAAREAAVNEHGWAYKTVWDLCPEHKAVTMIHRIADPLPQ